MRGMGVGTGVGSGVGYIQYKFDLCTCCSVVSTGVLATGTCYNCIARTVTADEAQS